MVEYAFLTQILAFLKSGRAVVSTVCGIVVVLTLLVLMAPMDSVREKTDVHRGEVWLAFLVAVAVLVVNAATWLGGFAEKLVVKRFALARGREQKIKEEAEKKEGEQRESERRRKQHERIYAELTPREFTLLRSFRANNRQPLKLTTRDDGVTLLLARRLIKRMTRFDISDVSAYYQIANEEFWGYFIEREDANHGIKP